MLIYCYRSADRSAERFIFQEYLSQNFAFSLFESINLSALSIDGNINLHPRSTWINELYCVAFISGWNVAPSNAVYFCYLPKCGSQVNMIVALDSSLYNMPHIFKPKKKPHAQQLKLLPAHWRQYFVVYLFPHGTFIYSPVLSLLLCFCAVFKQAQSVSFN